VIIKNLKSEKEKLKKTIIEETEVNQAFSLCEKLQIEIKNYKNITDSCLKTCSQLTTEIIQLKKELEKCNYNNNSGGLNLNSSVNTNNNGNILQNNNISRMINSNPKKISQTNFKKK